MTDSDVGPTDEVILHVRLDRARAAELHRWATLGQRSMEEAAVCAIEEYIFPVETAAHVGIPLPPCPPQLGAQ